MKETGRQAGRQAGREAGRQGGQGLGKADAPSTGTHVSRSKNLPLGFQQWPCHNAFGISKTLTCVRPRKDYKGEKGRQDLGGAETPSNTGTQVGRQWKTMGDQGRQDFKHHPTKVHQVHMWGGSGRQCKEGRLTIQQKEAKRETKGDKRRQDPGKADTPPNIQAVTLRKHYEPPTVQCLGNCHSLLLRTMRERPQSLRVAKGLRRAFEKCDFSDHPNYPVSPPYAGLTLPNHAFLQPTFTLSM